MIGESGEVADLLKKRNFYGKEVSDDKIIEEVGDVLYYFNIWLGKYPFPMETADLEFSIKNFDYLVKKAFEIVGKKNFSEIYRRNILKLLTRFPNGFNTTDAISQNDYK